jgi:hypothetical protein
MLSHLSWPILIILCLTLGLAPYSPQPHIIEKLLMLSQQELTRPIDIFDLLLHASPWLLLLAKLFVTVFSRGK